eukprot:COSAG01_NODE_6285_length_3753_cov_7.145047_2_plen_55_part_00
MESSIRILSLNPGRGSRPYRDSGSRRENSAKLWAWATTVTGRAKSTSPLMASIG